jgi:hypothetical protein
MVSCLEANTYGSILTGAAVRGYGFQGSDPAVVLFATGSAATANWCVSPPTNGGTQAHWKMMDEDGQPQGAAGPCTTADG